MLRQPARTEKHVSRGFALNPPTGGEYTPIFPLLALADAGSRSLGGGAIADQEERDIVSLAGAAREILDGVENRFLELIQRRVETAGYGFAQTRDAEQLFFGISSFCDALAKQHERVARF